MWSQLQPSKWQLDLPVKAQMYVVYPLTTEEKKQKQKSEEQKKVLFAITVLQERTDIVLYVI